MQRAKRKIKPGHEFDHLFPRPSNQSVQLKGATTARTTVEEMAVIARDRQSETAKLAPLLSRSELRRTCEAVWTFLVDHVNYKPDHPQIEQLRTPARTWADRAEGVDCDCYSIFISTVLLNLGVPHAFRVADYGKGWQHVYVVVPTAWKPIVIDPVLDGFNVEHPPKKIFDHPMKLEMLHGTPMGNVAQMQRYSPPVYPPANPAYQRTVSQVQDIRAAQAHRAFRGFGEAAATTAEPPQPNVVERAWNWVKANPVATGGIIVGGTLLGIGAARYFGKKKGKGKSSKSGQSLNGAASKSKRTKNAKTKAKKDSLYV